MNNVLSCEPVAVCARDAAAAAANPGSRPFKVSHCGCGAAVASLKCEKITYVCACSFAGPGQNLRAPFFFHGCSNVSNIGRTSVLEMVMFAVNSIARTRR